MAIGQLGRNLSQLTPGMQKGKAPHGPQHKIFAIDKLAASKNIPVAYESIQAKEENYTSSGKLAAITVMYKIAV